MAPTVKDRPVGNTSSRETAGALPRELSALLNARDAASRDRAWSAFVKQHSQLMLKAVRCLGGDYDTVMDQYTHALDRLRQDDFRRLRSYAADGRSKFTTWLAVVVRRLACDCQRQRYGRARDSEADARSKQKRVTRRRLADFVVERLDPSRSADPAGPNPERGLREAELMRALSAALDELAAKERLLIALRFEDGLSAREVAEVMGLPSPFHVYRRVHALLALLRRTLESRGIDGPAP